MEIFKQIVSQKQKNLDKKEYKVVKSLIITRKITFQSFYILFFLYAFVHGMNCGV